MDLDPLISKLGHVQEFIKSAYADMVKSKLSYMISYPSLMMGIITAFSASTKISFVNPSLSPSSLLMLCCLLSAISGLLFFEMEEMFFEGEVPSSHVIKLLDITRGWLSTATTMVMIYKVAKKITTSHQYVRKVLFRSSCIAALVKTVIVLFLPLIYPKESLISLCSGFESLELTLDMLCTMMLISDMHATATRDINYFRDITDLKRSQEAARQSQEDQPLWLLVMSRTCLLAHLVWRGTLEDEPSKAVVFYACLTTTHCFLLPAINLIYIPKFEKPKENGKKGNNTDSEQITVSILSTGEGPAKPPGNKESGKNGRTGNGQQGSVGKRPKTVYRNKFRRHHSALDTLIFTNRNGRVIEYRRFGPMDRIMIDMVGEKDIPSPCSDSDDGFD